MDEIKEANDCPPIDGGLCVSFHLRGFLHFFEANIPPPQMRAGGRSIENGWGLTGEIGFFFQHVASELLQLRQEVVSST